MQHIRKKKTDAIECEVQGAEADLHGNAALSGGVGDAAREADVAGVAPEVAPAVLHDPVVAAVVRAVADHQHAVVQCGAAGRIEDAPRIQLELTLIRLDGHANRLVGGRLQYMAPTCVGM